MKLVNLTPHKVVIKVGDKEIVVEPSGVVARVKEVVEDVGELVLDDGTAIPLRRKFLSSVVENLPEPQAETIYIVSYLAAQVAWLLGRQDVVATGDPIRDSEGNIVGIKSLYVKP
jgi:hypothetical protein